VTHETVPIGMGHEFSGTVVEIGPGVSAAFKFEVGQKVVVQPTISCGTCWACKAGIENACPNGGFIGLSGGGGGLSEEVVVPANAVLLLPDNLDLDIGALVEPLAVAWHAVSASPLASLDSSKTSVLVLGGGPIGLAVIQVLLAQGVSSVILSEVSSRRAAFGRSFGAHHILNPLEDDVVSSVRELCNDGSGADVVFDCAGVVMSLETACLSIRPRGTIVNVAIWEKAVPFNPNLLVFREGQYVAVLGYQKRDFEAVIEALADGRIKPGDMITSRIRMDDLVEKGMCALVKDKEAHCKVLVDVKAG